MDASKKFNDIFFYLKDAHLSISLLFFIPGMVQASTESYLAGKGSTPVITAKTVADHLAAKLNAKLNYQPNEADAPPDVDKEVRFLLDILL